MRKIVSKEQEERRNKKRQVIVGVVLILILMLSTFGIVIDSFGSKSNDGEIEYNEIIFTSQGKYWTAQKDGFNLIFSYNPLQINQFQETIMPLSELYSKPLYLYSEDDLALQEIILNLDPRNNKIAQRLQLACPPAQNCTEDFPKKDCANNFIIIKLAESSSIKQENKCLTISGNETEILKETDRALFKLFNLVP